jgi:hypothetical protein
VEMFDDDFDDDMFDDISSAKAASNNKGSGSKKDEVAKKVEAAKATKQKEREKGKAGNNDDWPDADGGGGDGKRENLSAQDRIAAMKARLAGIRARCGGRLSLVFADSERLAISRKRRWSPPPLTGRRTLRPSLHPQRRQDSRRRSPRR